MGRRLFRNIWQKLSGIHFIFNPLKTSTSYFTNWKAAQKCEPGPATQPHSSFLTCCREIFRRITYSPVPWSGNSTNTHIKASIGVTVQQRRVYPLFGTNRNRFLCDARYIYASSKRTMHRPRAWPHLQCVGAITQRPLVIVKIKIFYL